MGGESATSSRALGKKDGAAMVRRTRIPLLVFAAALVGCGAGDDAATMMPRAGAGGRGGGPGAGAKDGGAGAGANGGGPGAAAKDASAGAGAASADASRAPVAKVLVSEIMYHPVAENAAADNHEFIEIYNASDTIVSLAGWKIEGEITFTFPMTATIGPRQYRIVAKSPMALAQVRRYGLAAADVLGPYEGQLANGGGQVTLRDAPGGMSDTAAWDDKFPWAHAADAFGAGAQWFAANDPRAKPMDHQYMGVSLERVSFESSGEEAANWEPSAIDGATPGKPRMGDATVRPIVEDHIARAEGSMDSQIIRPMQKIVVTVKFTPRLASVIRSAKLEYFVDELGKTDEPRMSARLTSMGEGTFRTTLESYAQTTLVRYRIVADRGITADEVISPRPSDPFGWYGFFVEPAVQTNSKFYHLWIEPKNWGQVYANTGIAIPPAVDRNFDQRRMMGTGALERCMLRTVWDDRVPGTMVSQGRVFDVLLRFAGSRWNRPNGRTIPPDRIPVGPEDPMGRRYPMRALSWNISLPRYRPFDGGVKSMIWNKMDQACPGINNVLADKLYTAAGVPAPKFNGYTRVHVNGSYYHYMMDIEHPDEVMLKRYVKKGEPVGELYKSQGSVTSDEGPWGWADGRAFPATCNFTPSQRYVYNYDRTDDDGRNLDDVEKLITEHTAARTAAQATMWRDTKPLRDFFSKNFDVPMLTSYVAVRNWSATWDDNLHNYFLWKRPSDGKWVMFGWDFDLEFGQFSEAAFTWGFYMGRQNMMGNEFSNRDNSVWNHFKDSFIRGFKSELDARIKELSAGILSTAMFNQTVDQAWALYDLKEAMSAPSGIACTPANKLRQVKTFGEMRPVTVRNLLGM